MFRITRKTKNNLCYLGIWAWLVYLVLPFNSLVLAQEASESGILPSVTPMELPSLTPTIIAPTEIPVQSPTPTLIELTPTEVPAETPTPTTIEQTPTEIPTQSPTPTLIELIPTETPLIFPSPTSTPSLEESPISIPSASFRQPVKVKLLSGNILQAGENLTLELINTDGNPISAKLVKGKTEIETTISLEQTWGSKILVVEPPPNLQPGQYSLTVIDSLGNSEAVDFSWGVLAINTNKSIYLPQEIAKLSMAVLDKEGKMVCDAKLELRIKEGDREDVLSTENGRIIVNPECQIHAFTEKPDYEASYQVAGAGTYRLTLSAETRSGFYSIEDSFEVRETIPFEVERTSATRIYPPSTYPVNLKIIANEDFNGEIIETVPSNFEISAIENSKIVAYEKIEEAKVLSKQNTIDEVPADLILPFTGNFPITLEFGEIPSDKNLQLEYEQFGAIGHDGVDFGLPEGTEVLAVDDGEVIQVGEGDYGITIILKHKWGLSYYGHLSEVSVSLGQEVKKGEVIGLSGDSGFSTGPHLHFSLRPNKYDTGNGFLGKVDPAVYLGVDKNLSKLKNIVWRVNLKKGETINLGYQYLAPQQSPALYLLGPLKFSKGNQIIFQEARQWQIAADAGISFGVATTKGTTAGFGRTGNGNITATLPTGWSAGQLAILVLYSDQGSGSTPTDWTQVSGSPWGSSTPKLQAFYRFLQSGDSNPVTTISGSATNMSHVAAIATYNDVNTSTPIEVVGTASAGTGTPMTAGSIDTLTDGAWVLGLCGRGDNENASGQTFGGSATGVAERFDSGTSSGNDSQVSLYDKTIASYGATGNGSATTSTTDPWVSVLIALKPAPEVPGIDASVGKSTDSWCGAVPVYGTLTGGLSHENYPYARVKVDTPASQTFYASMSWDATDERFEGTIYPGSNYCNGCADPTTGTFTVTVQLDNDPNFGSIDYTDGTSFSTYITRRKSSKDDSYDYTDPNPVWNTDHWDYTVSDFKLYASSTQSNVAIAIPFHPTTADINNLGVSFNGTPISEGSAESTTNAWWWDEATHTLYVQFASLSTEASGVDVDITFTSDTDLWATRFDHVHTNGMGDRLFYNGLFIANQYLTTSVYGGGHENSGMQAESRAHEPGGADSSSDCMEREAVHVDNTIRADSSGSYSADIKWKQQQWADYLTSENNSQLVIETDSDDTASTGWAQQLDNDISAHRTITVYAQEIYLKNVYGLTNNDTSSHVYPFVWQREPWIGPDRDTNDVSRYYGDSSDVVLEKRNSMTSYDVPLVTAYDNAVFTATSVCFKETDIDSSTYGVFATEAFLSNSSPWAEWPISITDKGSTNLDQIGFEHTFSSVAADETVTYEFYHFHYKSTSWANIETMVNSVCEELNTEGPSGPTLNDLMRHGNWYNSDGVRQPFTF